jgi:hypothetical protein
MGINDFIRKHNAKVTAASSEPPEEKPRTKVTAAASQPADEKPSHEGPAKEGGPGFWGGVGGGLRAIAEAGAERDRRVQARKAREHELKAGKTFRRTKKHLKKAERHQRRAGATETTTVDVPRAVNRERAEEAKREQAQEPTVPPSSGNDVIDQLERLGKLKHEGILSDEEFQAQKTKLLGN